jgi:hypothetical protein
VERLPKWVLLAFVGGFWGLWGDFGFNAGGCGIWGGFLGPKCAPPTPKWRVERGEMCG